MFQFRHVDFLSTSCALSRVALSSRSLRHFLSLKKPKKTCITVPSSRSHWLSVRPEGQLALLAVAACKWGKWKVAEKTPENHHCPLLGSTCLQCKLLLLPCFFQHFNPLLRTGFNSIRGGTVFVFTGSGVDSLMNSLHWSAAEKTESKPVHKQACDKSDKSDGQVMLNSRDILF